MQSLPPLPYSALWGDSAVVRSLFSLLWGTVLRSLLSTTVLSSLVWGATLCSLLSTIILSSLIWGTSVSLVSLVVHGCPSCAFEGKVYINRTGDRGEVAINATLLISRHATKGLCSLCGYQIGVSVESGEILCGCPVASGRGASVCSGRNGTAQGTYPCCKCSDKMG